MQSWREINCPLPIRYPSSFEMSLPAARISEPQLWSVPWFPPHLRLKWQGRTPYIPVHSTPYVRPNFLCSSPTTTHTGPINITPPHFILCAGEGHLAWVSGPPRISICDTYVLYYQGAAQLPNCVWYPVDGLSMVWSCKCLTFSVHHGGVHQGMWTIHRTSRKVFYNSLTQSDIHVLNVTTGIVSLIAIDLAKG